jgi:MFS family permease
MSAKPTSSTQNTHWGKVSIALCAGLFVSMQVGKLGPAIPVLRDDLGLSLVDAGYALSIFTLLAIFLAVPLGAFSTFFGRRSIIVLGIISVMIGTLGSTVITQPWMFLVLRALEGFGFIAIAVNIPAFITHLAAPQDRTRALGVWSIYMPTGMAFALLVSTPFLTQIGWRGLWIVMFLLAIPLLIGLWWALEEPSTQQTREPRAIARMVANSYRAPGLLMVGTCFGVYTFQWVTIMQWLPSFLNEEVGLTLEHAIYFTAAVVFMNGPGCYVGVRFAARGVRSSTLIIIGAVTMGVLTFAIFGAGVPPTIRLILCMIYSLIGGFIPANLFLLVPQYAPDLRHVSIGNGILMQGSAVGQTLGAPIVAALVTKAGGDWSVAIWPMLVMSGCVFLLGYFGFRRSNL